MGVLIAIERWCTRSVRAVTRLTQRRAPVVVRHRALRVLLVLPVLGTLLLAFAGRTHAQGTAGEYEVKAAFLYNFGKFVEWPAEAFASPSTPLTLCVVGTDPFGEILDRTVSGKTINGRAIAARRLGKGDELRTCHILFISPSERQAIAEILAHVRGHAVLVVGETEGLAARGGMFNFVVESNRVRFEANPAAAERCGLRISSKLLALARVVQSQEDR